MVNYNFLKSISKKIVAGGLTAFIAISANSAEVFAGRTFKTAVPTQNSSNAKKPCLNRKMRLSYRTHRMLSQMRRDFIVKILGYQKTWENSIIVGVAETDISYTKIYKHYSLLCKCLENDDALNAAFDYAGYLQGVSISLGCRCPEKSHKLFLKLIADGSVDAVKSKLRDFADDTLGMCEDLSDDLD